MGAHPVDVYTQSYRERASVRDHGGTIIESKPGGVWRLKGDRVLLKVHSAVPHSSVRPALIARLKALPEVLKRLRY